MKIFEREEIKYASALQPGVKARELCQETYEARHYTPSLPDEDLRRVMEEKSRVGPRLNAQGAHIAVAAWRLLCQAYDKAAGKLLGNAWLAYLLLVGSVCRARRSGSAFLVLRACEHGALIWPMLRHSDNGLIALFSIRC